MRRLGIVLGLVVCCAATAAAKDIYVDNTSGDNRYTGRQTQPTPDMSGPVRTIGRAIELAGPGDRIVLAATDEPYRESLSLVGTRLSGFRQAPLTIDGGNAVLDGSATVPPEWWKHFEGAVFYFRPPQKGQQQLFVDDVPLKRVYAAQFDKGRPELEPLEWCYYGGDIYFCVEPTKLPDDYRLTFANLPTGITLYHVRNVVIQNLTVQGFQVDGLSAANSARGVRLGGITARGNGRAGISVGGASQVEIALSVVGNNGQAQILTSPYSETAVRHSDLFSNTAPAWVDEGGRFFLGGQRLEGGISDRDVLEAPQAEPQPEAQPEAQP